MKAKKSQQWRSISTLQVAIKRITISKALGCHSGSSHRVALGINHLLMISVDFILNSKHLQNPLATWTCFLEASANVKLEVELGEEPGSSDYTLYLMSDSYQATDSKTIQSCPWHL